jgi:hypothetical protein
VDLIRPFFIASLCLWSVHASARTILFIGNSFTYGAHSAAHHFRSDTVRDLNPPNAQGQTVGGVPAIFKAFTVEAGLENYDVSIETVGGKGFDYHLAERRALIDKPWDVVVGHGFSLLDQARPGDPKLLVSSAKQMSDLLSARNPAVKFYLLSTWSRADMVYTEGKPWSGKPITQMGKDIAAAYDMAAKGAPRIAGVIPLGVAWNTAMETGLADDNPYDDLGARKINLWAYDHYHASVFGYYLEALLDFGQVTGRDPQSLEKVDHVAEDLGISPVQMRALQKLAHDTLVAHGVALSTPK